MRGRAAVFDGGAAVLLFSKLPSCRIPVRITAEPRGVGHRSLKVLVVDDEEFHLSFAQSVLVRGGHMVFAASSGPEALVFLDLRPNQRLDIAVLDVVMPGMDGVALAAHIQSRRPDLPILFMSACSGHPELRPDVTRDLPFVQKPLSTLNLNKAMAAVLRVDAGLQA